MKIFASSGDEAGGGINIPDQPSGDNSGPAPVIDYSGGMDAQRNAIAQAMMVQQAQQAQQMQQQPQYGGGGDPWAAYAAMFAPRGPISGSVTDVGWMDALQPNQGGVTVGGQPGTPVNNPFIGGGSMARPNADYWNRQLGGGGGFNPAMVGMSDRDWATWTSLVSPQVAQQFINERLGGGPGNSGDAGMSSGGGAPGGDNSPFGPGNTAVGPNGISSNEANQAANAPNATGPVGMTVGGIGQGVNGPGSFGYGATGFDGQAVNGVAVSGPSSVGFGPGWGGGGVASSGGLAGGAMGWGGTTGEALGPVGGANGAAFGGGDSATGWGGWGGYGGGPI
jgi:hypothetical protein